MSEYKYPKTIKLKMEEEVNALEAEFKKENRSKEELELVRVCFENGFLKALTAVKNEGLLK